MQCYDCQQCEVRHWNHTTLFIAHYYLQSERGLYESESPADRMARLLCERAEVLPVRDYHVVEFVYHGSRFIARMRASSGKWVIRGRNIEHQIKNLSSLFQILDEARAMEEQIIPPNATVEQCKEELRKQFGNEAVGLFLLYRKRDKKNQTPAQTYDEVVQFAKSMWR